MELKEIRELMVAMRRFGTKRLHLKKKDVELELEREVEKPTELVVENKNDIQKLKNEALSQAKEMPLTKDFPKPPEKPQQYLHINSPMVGTFYTASSPTAASFVKVGDTVDVDTIVCIIEAMKVMNEIKAGVTGVIEEVLVENTFPVEFGTPLFKLKKG